MARKKDKQNLKRKNRWAERAAPAAESFAELDIPREIQYITQHAQAEDARIVRLGNLVLFSTRTRDAWLLDIEDQFALCLCRDGEPQPFKVVDSAQGYSIDWPARFTIDEGAFIVQERSGRIVAIHGYPVVEIAAACRGG